MNKTIFLSLIFITFVSFGLRFYKLGELPSILNRDEAALAYNGYLLAEVGKDEWRQSWPLTLQSFGDYKLPGYSTVLAGLFAFMPLTDATVRIPSALAGSLLPVALFWLARNLRFSNQQAILAALITAITPIFFLLLSNRFRSECRTDTFSVCLSITF